MISLYLFEKNLLGMCVKCKLYVRPCSKFNFDIHYSEKQFASLAGAALFRPAFTNFQKRTCSPRQDMSRVQPLASLKTV